MTRDSLASLGQQAPAFSQAYVKLVEALQAEGVPEATARQEARATAAMMLVYEAELEEGETCPLCGKG